MSAAGIDAAAQDVIDLQALAQQDTPVHIHNLAQAELPMLQDVLARVRTYQRAKSIDIHVQARVPQAAPPYKRPGFAEYLVVVSFEDGGKLTIGAIQRQIGAKTEFHS